MRTFILVAVFSLLIADVFGTESGKVPDGGKGYIGYLKGAIVSNEKGIAKLKVSAVLEVDKNSAASKPDSLIGQEIRVAPGHGGGGVNDVQAAFVRGLDIGEEVTLQLKHHEGDLFLIMELTQEQRESIGRDRNLPIDWEDKKGQRRPRGKN
jgi:hypothetical protein